MDSMVVGGGILKYINKLYIYRGCKIALFASYPSYSTKGAVILSDNRHIRHIIEEL